MNYEALKVVYNHIKSGGFVNVREKFSDNQYSVILPEKAKEITEEDYKAVEKAGTVMCDVQFTTQDEVISKYNVTSQLTPSLCCIGDHYYLWFPDEEWDLYMILWGKMLSVWEMIESVAKV